MDNQQKQWDESYDRMENFVFYPHEEVIRFFSKYIRRRTGLDDFIDIVPFKTPPKILDLGCGIGRHIYYANRMGLDAYGIDLSESAIKTTWEWAKREGFLNYREKIKQGDIRKMPFPKNYFDFATSHGVLDSMYFEIAKEAITELARVMKKGALFYCDLISGDDSLHFREFDGEEVVQTKHEKGTIQAYFNFTKIRSLMDSFFDIVECFLVKKESIISNQSWARYHLVLRKK
jgi:ubiquinone/menaquinone biosynthesis C-methylase UbiE